MTRISRRRISLTALITLSVSTLFLSDASATFYKWTDANGRVHYSDERPEDKNIKTSTLDFRTSSITRSQKDEPKDSDKTVSQPEQEVQSTEATRIQGNIKESPDRCTAGRKELAILSRKMPIYVDSNGSFRPNWARDTSTTERTYLSEAERKTALEVAKKTINSHCKKPDDAAQQEQAHTQWLRSEYCILNRVILSELKNEKIAPTHSELEKQQALTDEYCKNSTAPVLKIGPW